METKSEKQTSSRVAILEKTDSEIDFVNFSDFEKALDLEFKKKEDAKEILFSNKIISTDFATTVVQTPKTEVSNEIEESFELNEDVHELSAKFEKMEQKEEAFLNEAEISVETDTTSCKEAEIELSKEVENDFEEEHKARFEKVPQKKLYLKTRLKIFLCTFCAILVCMSGWAIYNAVKIQTLTEQLHQANTEYSVNVAKYIKNISKLDDLTNPSSLTNLDELEKAKVVSITPRQLQDPIEYEVKSNWFDRFCNWISNLFN